MVYFLLNKKMVNFEDKDVINYKINFNNVRFNINIAKKVGDILQMF